MLSAVKGKPASGTFIVRAVGGPVNFVITSPNAKVIVSPRSRPARTISICRLSSGSDTATSAIGAPHLNLLVGRALPGVAVERQRAAIVSALRSFAPIAGEHGLRILS